MFNNISNYANTVDYVMMIIVGVSAFMLIGITLAMIFFVIRYHRKKHPVAKQIDGNVALEIIWTVIPAIILLIMFWYGYDGFMTLRAETKIDNEVKVYAFMWGWEFEYANGKKSDTLYIPVNKITKLKLTSRDVMHSLFIPAMRLKEDVIANAEHFMILTPNQEGVFDIACAEYCGLNHSKMYTKLNIVTTERYNQWLNLGMQQDSVKIDTNQVSAINQ